MNTKDWLIKIIQATGGVVEDDLFVTRPGIMVESATALTTGASNLFNLLNIPRDLDDYERVGEFHSRLTYMNFQDHALVPNSMHYNERMAKEFGHLSVHASTVVTFIIAGVSLETAMEFVAHGEAKIARLTSSNTKAMDDTLYRLQGSEEERTEQKSLILDFLRLRAKHNIRTREFRNINNLGSKVTVLSFSMTIKDYHKLFIGRIPIVGNETEVREVSMAMCDVLHSQYPLVIRQVDEYMLMGNAKKYEVM